MNSAHTTPHTHTSSTPKVIRLSILVKSPVLQLFKPNPKVHLKPNDSLLSGPFNTRHS